MNHDTVSPLNDIDPISPRGHDADREEQEDLRSPSDGGSPLRDDEAGTRATTGHVRPRGRRRVSELRLRALVHASWHHEFLSRLMGDLDGLIYM